jgi:hypothetical protein
MLSWKLWMGLNVFHKKNLEKENIHNAILYIILYIWYTTTVFLDMNDLKIDFKLEWKYMKKSFIFLLEEEKKVHFQIYIILFLNVIDLK